MTSNDVRGRLASLLEQEREAMLTGRFDDLGNLIQEKARLISVIEAGNPSPDSLVAIRQDADRNARLLSAALRGFRDASARIKQVRDGTAEFNTYSQSGLRQVVGSGGQKFERRA